MEKIVFTNGCFDIIHAGHIRLLQECACLGDCVIVGLNSDKSIRNLKGPSRPINDQEKRKIVLESIRYVDGVIIFDSDSPLKLIKELKPSILVKGGDYKEDEIIGSDFVKSYGGKVVIVNLVKGISTTSIVQTTLRNYLNNKEE